MSVFKKGVRSSADAGPITTMLNRTLVRKNSQSRRRSFAGSVGMCYRQATFPLVVGSDAPKTTFGAAAHFYTEMGTAAHELVEKAFKEDGSLLYAEAYCPDVGLNIGGYIDVLATIDDRVRIVEIKTCGALPAKPKAPHKAQALVYTVLTGIRNPILFYISRNVATWQGKLMTAELEVLHTDEELFTTALNMSVAHFSSLEGFLPPKPSFMAVKSHCGFCPHVSQCFDSHPFHKSIKHPDPKLWNVVFERSHEYATELIATMDERREWFLEHIKEFGGEKTSYAKSRRPMGRP